MKKYYWHFTSDKLRDGRPIPKRGVWLVHDGPVEMCCSGLHASEHPFDALQYAPGILLHKVELREIVDIQSDKIVARQRKIVATHDMSEICRKFARQQALSVVKNWKTPAPDIVIKWLKYGKEKFREAAEAAAEAASWSAAEAAARSAAEAAAEAAWSAAEAAARSAARAAARSAAEAAARSAAEAAAKAAAWSAAEAAAKKQFLFLVNKEFRPVTK